LEVGIKANRASVPWVVEFRNNSDGKSHGMSYDLLDLLLRIDLVLTPCAIESHTGE
jgi:hypothetical protein